MSVVIALDVVGHTEEMVTRSERNFTMLSAKKRFFQDSAEGAEETDWLIIFIGSSYVAFGNWNNYELLPLTEEMG